MSSNWKLQTIFDGDRGVNHGLKKWKTRRAIGTGAYGSVCLQELTWRGPTSFRAVKTIQKSTTNPASRKYLTEVEVLSRVAHRDDLFVKFLGWYEDKTFIYIAMEFIKDGDLSHYIQNYQPEVKGHAKEITKQLLTGLEVLHSLNICHRDLKPKNILIASCNPLHVKIADFGIAKIEMDTVLRTHIGTHGYFAPEIMPMIRYEIKGFKPSIEYTNAVDMWAVGVLLHEMLTSEIPFLLRGNDNTSGSTTCSGVVGGNMMHGKELDFRLLKEFCAGREDLPLGLLESGNNTEVSKLLRSLITPNPNHRISAVLALRNEWIESSRPSVEGVSEPDPLPPLSMDPKWAPRQVEAQYYDYLDCLWMILGIIWPGVLDCNCVWKRLVTTYWEYWGFIVSEVGSMLVSVLLSRLLDTAVGRIPQQLGDMWREKERVYAPNPWWLLMCGVISHLITGCMSISMVYLILFNRARSKIYTSPG